ncbi:OPT superfamily [Rhizina undulata]
MMSMPSSLIGFAIFKSMAKHLKLPFTPVENVLVQTVAVAVGSMPLSAGFVGVIPALEKLLTPAEGGPINLRMDQLIFWSIGVAFFGVFFAVPLRRQVIIREKLKFPSGTATALMISVLHGKEQEKPSSQDNIQTVAGYQSILTTSEAAAAADGDLSKESTWKEKTNLLLYSFAISGVYTLFSYFFPMFRDLPIFGSAAAANWLWTLNPSPAYVGQGIIMGASTTLHMLLGAVIGWGILSPLAKNKGWAPGPVNDWQKGSRGWIVWISLAIMLADSVISLSGLLLEPLIRRYIESKGQIPRRGSYRPIVQGGNSGDECVNDDDLPEEDAPPEHLVPNKVVLGGLIASGLLCIIAIKTVFPQTPLYATIVAFLVALVLSVMGVRALGQTDLNPVSGISKLTQLLFALIVPASNPNAVLINLVAGAVSEAGAQQAGDIMQDLKTGHMLGAAPRAQFYGQLIGSVFGALISAGVYRLYTAVYPVPGELFQVPTAHVWIDCSRLVFGEGLPQGAWEFSVLFAAIFTVTTILRGWVWKGNKFIPGGIAVAVGMYNVPSFTLARAAGGLVQWYWNRYYGRSKGETPLVILASGLILGEGIVSIINLAMASFNVPHT